MVLHNLTWQTYQTLLADMGEHRSARLAYDCGTLEIKMPSKLHELINRLLERIITTLTEELGMNLGMNALSLGSTTFDSEDVEQGVEPDSCFYIQHNLVGSRRVFFPLAIWRAIAPSDPFSFSEIEIALHPTGMAELWAIAATHTCSPAKRYE